MKARFQPAGMQPLRIPVDLSRGVRQLILVSLSQSCDEFLWRSTESLPK